MQDNTVSSLTLVSSGNNYVDGDICLQDSSGSGSGFSAKFSVDKVTGAVTRCDAFVSEILR